MLSATPTIVPSAPTTSASTMTGRTPAARDPEDAEHGDEQ
jgi:hypothetical protein